MRTIRKEKEWKTANSLQRILVAEQIPTTALKTSVPDPDPDPWVFWVSQILPPTSKSIMKNLVSYSFLLKNLNK
jgi:hypothetical protein